MMLLSHSAPLPEAYRFVVRITGESLPETDKALRLRCTLSADDHSLVGVSAMIVHLGTATSCDEAIEFIHTTATRDGLPPKYYALSATMAPVSESTVRLRQSPPDWTYVDRAEHRVAGIMDPAESRVVVPSIVLGET
jgi:hypothetical protein